MIGNTIALFRARRDPALAAGLARELVVEGAMERASFPLTIAKFWMGLALFALTVLAGIFLWGGIAGHWTVALPAILPVGVIVLIVRIWRGLDRGKARVLAFAQAQSAVGVENIKARLSRETPPDKAPT
jgi:uncharacterized membrane protein YhhN